MPGHQDILSAPSVPYPTFSLLMHTTKGMLLKLVAKRTDGAFREDVFHTDRIGAGV